MKNASLATGLSMRSMDLDNIIDEEDDDDCFDRLLQTTSNFMSEDMVDVKAQVLPVLGNIKQNYKGPDEDICKVVDFMKSMTSAKLNSREGAEEFLTSDSYYWSESIGEFKIDAFVSMPTMRSITLYFMLEWTGNPEQYAMYDIVGEELEEIADIIQRCVV